MDQSTRVDRASAGRIPRRLTIRRSGAPATMRKIQLYSAHCEPQTFIAPRLAAKMVADGDAIPHDEQRCGRCHRVPDIECRDCGGSGYIVTAIRRALGTQIVRSPAAISAREMRLAAAGEMHAAQKLRWWPVVGNPALRHAQ